MTDIPQTTNYIYWSGQKIDDMDRDQLIKCFYYIASDLKVKEEKLFRKNLFLSISICFLEGCAALTGVVFSCMIIACFLKLYGVIL